MHDRNSDAGRAASYPLIICKLRSAGRLGGGGASEARTAPLWAQPAGAAAAGSARSAGKFGVSSAVDARL